MMKKIPIIFCIDVEPDIFQVDRRSKRPWIGFEKYFEYSKRLRDELAEWTKQPVHFSWFYRIDPQVKESYGDEAWGLSHYESFLRHFVDQGDEIGIHPHAFRWVEQKRYWISDHKTQSWVDHCLRMAVDGYQKIFNKKPLSHRYGARWINNKAVNLAEDLGIRYDLTLEPGFGAKEGYSERIRSNAPYPDFRKIVQYPYKPQRNDYQKIETKNPRGMWMIPMSTGFCRFNFGRLERLYRTFMTPHVTRPFCKSLNLGICRARFFKEIVDFLCSSLEKPYLATVVRTDCGNDPQQLQFFRENIDQLKTHPASDRFVFATPEEASQLMGYISEPTAVSSR